MAAPAEQLSIGVPSPEEMGIDAGVQELADAFGRPLPGQPAQKPKQSHPESDEHMSFATPETSVDQEGFYEQADQLSGLMELDGAFLELSGEGKWSITVPDGDSFTSIPFSDFGSAGELAGGLMERLSFGGGE